MVNGQNVVKDGMTIILDRTFKSPTYSIPNRFKVSIDTPDVAFADTSLTTVVPISGTELIDACNAQTGWTATGGTVTVNSSTFKPDGTTDGALNLTKTATASAVVSVTKATTSVNGTSKNLLAWLYVKDSTVLSYLTTSTTAFAIRLGSDASNYYEKQYLASSLATGWNWITVSIPSGFTTTTGTPTVSALDYSYLATTATTATVTWSAGDIVFDAIRVASADDYYKAVDSITTNDTDSSVSIVSKLTVSEANGFLINGLGNFNTDSSELMFAKSKFPNNSKDTTDLFKFTTKVKFKNVNQ